MYTRSLLALALTASFATAQSPAPAPVPVALSRACAVSVPAPMAHPAMGPMVRAEMTIVRIHPDTMKELELWEEGTDHSQRCFLTSCQTRKVLDRLKADDRCEVLGSPQLVVMDSQNAMVCTSNADGSGFMLEVTPRVSMDHKFIQMRIAAEHKEVAICQEKCPSKNGECDGVRRTEVQLNHCETVATIPTGNTVMWEVCRPKCAVRCDLVLGTFMKAELVASKERHVCVIVTPTELTDTACCQPMPPTTCDGPGCCHLVAAQPCPAALPCPMTLPCPTKCSPAMPPRTFTFVAAQEQCEPARRELSATLVKLLDKYHSACADGDTEKARKLARRCLDIDPTCFTRDR